jgi:uncharacterized protein (UPF0332 family)
MEGSIKELSQYRLSRAEEDLDTSRKLFDGGELRLSLNRSYYAIFHALRAVNALDGFDSSKHSGVIAHFNQYHVKTGDFPKNVSRMIAEAMEIRQRSDYEDFFIASKADAEKQLANAETVVSLTRQYLQNRFSDDEF